jgi:hypothetical protein
MLPQTQQEIRPRFLCRLPRLRPAHLLRVHTRVSRMGPPEQPARFCFRTPNPPRPHRNKITIRGGRGNVVHHAGRRCRGRPTTTTTTPTTTTDRTEQGRVWAWAGMDKRRRAPAGGLQPVLCREGPGRRSGLSGMSAVCRGVNLDLLVMTAARRVDSRSMFVWYLGQTT